VVVVCTGAGPPRVAPISRRHPSSTLPASAIPYELAPKVAFSATGPMSSIWLIPRRRHRAALVLEECVDLQKGCLLARAERIGENNGEIVKRETETNGPTYKTLVPTIMLISCLKSHNNSSKMPV
jgi:hypothetical protein